MAGGTFQDVLVMPQLLKPASYCHQEQGGAGNFFSFYLVLHTGKDLYKSFPPYREI